MHDTRAWTLFTFVAAVSACGNEETRRVGDDDVATRLSQLRGVTVSEPESAVPRYRVFDLRVEQLLDHDDPSAGTFEQRVIVSHIDEAAPTVVATDGYFLQYSAITPVKEESVALGILLEPASITGANQIEIEHRYFAESVPADNEGEARFRFLTTEQSARDIHAIIELLRPIYSGPLVSSGVSKGGVTALIHRYYFPDDVSATVAYVAPYSNSTNDTRYLTFLENVGDAECRDKLSAFQRAVLEQRQAVVTEIQSQIAGTTITPVAPLDEIVEASVVLLPFVFWQYLGPDWCDVIPPPSAPVDWFVAFLADVGFPGLSSAEEDRFAPYSYQVERELGHPALPTAHIADLLLYYEPHDDALFNPAPMRAVHDWVATSAERVMLVYGEVDPWTAGAFVLPSDRDNVRYTAPRRTHDASLRHLPRDAENAATETLLRWTAD